jgi:hypothetical protein
MPVNGIAKQICGRWIGRQSSRCHARNESVNHASEPRPARASRHRHHNDAVLSSDNRNVVKASHPAPWSAHDEVAPKWPASVAAARCAFTAPSFVERRISGRRVAAAESVEWHESCSPWCMHRMYPPPIGLGREHSPHVRPVRLRNTAGLGRRRR